MSTSATRTLNIVKTLKGHSLNGLSNQEIATALKESPSNITRAIDTLISAGMVRKLETGRFALSVQTLQIAVSHLKEMEKAKHQIDELNQRVLAGAQND